MGAYHTKPSAFAEINRSHPHAFGLEYYSLCNNGPSIYDSVGRRSGGIFIGGVRRSTDSADAKAGGGIETYEKSLVTGSVEISPQFNIPTGNTPFTIELIYKLNGTGNIGAAGLWNFFTQSTQKSTQYVNGFCIGAADGYPLFYYLNSAQSNGIGVENRTAELSKGVLHHAIAVHRSDSLTGNDLWHDGTNQRTQWINVPGWAGTAAGSKALINGVWHTSGIYGSVLMTCYGVGFWSRALGEKEIRERFANPWQMFENTEEIILSAGGIIRPQLNGQLMGQLVGQGVV